MRVAFGLVCVPRTFARLVYARVALRALFGYAHPVGWLRSVCLLVVLRLHLHIRWFRGYYYGLRLVDWLI